MTPTSRNKPPSRKKNTGTNQHKSTDGHKPRKRFGQNFLHDPRVIQSILSTINAQKNDHIVEIGPGLGALTGGLLTDCGKLDVIELDQDLVPHLENRFGHSPLFQIHSADALKFDFSAMETPEEMSNDRLIRIVGNLPYNISTPLIFHLLSQSHVIQDMHFMLQKEVVDRLCAGAGESAYGRLGIMVQYHCETERVISVGPGAFNPPPKVDSAVIRLTPHKQKPVSTQNVELLSKVVTAAFNQRRKTIRNGLKNLADSTLLEAAGIDPSERAENIALKQFANLADLLHTNYNIQP
ncbi:MAG: 16S rRNA (adenine(1518)-N(6)/adenine(1519)-N(6))-dimethyltransferase RsmA [Pseudomonadales bacterium]|nr:16S rRNA (adenine(1518)-N(6)/adenine(1519)-N(6))-dimethyltransferase RsmA [Pseudomonadales bacterium]